MSLCNLNNGVQSDLIPEKQMIIETLYEFCLEFALCFYSIYFWNQLSLEYKFLKENIQVLLFILYKISKFCLHLFLLAISLSIALHWKFVTDSKMDFVQITIFIALLDYIVLRETTD